MRDDWQLVTKRDKRGRLAKRQATPIDFVDLTRWLQSGVYMRRNTQNGLEVYCTRHRPKGCASRRVSFDIEGWEFLDIEDLVPSSRPQGNPSLPIIYTPLVNKLRKGICVCRSIKDCCYELYENPPEELLSKAKCYFVRFHCSLPTRTRPQSPLLDEIICASTPTSTPSPEID